MGGGHKGDLGLRNVTDVSKICSRNNVTFGFVGRTGTLMEQLTEEFALEEPLLKMFNLNGYSVQDLLVECAERGVRLQAGFTKVDRIPDEYIAQND